MPTTTEFYSPIYTWINYNLLLFGAYLGFPPADLSTVFGRVARALFGLLGLIFLLLVIWSGFSIMISGGDEEKVNKAKKTFFNAVIGLVIILMSYAIVSFIIGLFVPVTPVP